MEILSFFQGARKLFNAIYIGLFSHKKPYLRRGIVCFVKYIGFICICFRFYIKPTINSRFDVNETAVTKIFLL